jgi:tRNA (guanine37-N1)-methyltransferase
MIFDIITIFPAMLESPLQEGILRRAKLAGQIEVNAVHLRDFAEDRHQMTDDRPYGGGEGMVMKPEPLAAAVRQCRSRSADAKVVLLSPQGRRYNQQMAAELAQERHLMLVCGRYEGVDERFRKRYVDLELSLGDFIITGGELAALIIVDSVSRLLPGVLGCSASAENDSFSHALLKHPQYTRPNNFEGMEVPRQLLSGNHQEIKEYRFVASVSRTLERRPDLLGCQEFSAAQKKWLKKAGLLEKIGVLMKKAERTSE